MIGALHGRDVVLRSATFDVINDHSTMPSSYTMSWLARYIEGMLFFYLKSLLAKGGRVDRSFIKSTILLSTEHKTNKKNNQELVGERGTS